MPRSSSCSMLGTVARCVSAEGSDMRRYDTGMERKGRKPPARLCVIRHGETAWNAEGRVQGQTDVPLSPLGAAQAAALVAALAGERFGALYASDLARVRQTAAPLARALRLAPRLDPALRER